MSEIPEYNPTDLDRAAVQIVLERITESQSSAPECVVCGQRANILDRFGACSKTTTAHQEHRAELEAEENIMQKRSR
ncbi:hypothetical protein [Microbacterium sp. BR1]|uniref:hypothetical protein n=1 Tax=Microbacterium sp. BR1 TaxID=1070896 RepID=UPI0012FE10C2|nr:hypothetical protein [Microbacterium sp. BR1]